MICISIAQESRRFALVDMMNAAPQCDLLEVRLDRFGNAPDLADIVAFKSRPLIMSCRRPCDGGGWDGTEEQRLALLRQAIISKADYVEIELDVADKIRPFPPAKRVIAYTNRAETPANLAEIYAEALTKKPDVIKLTTLARTPEEAWPLVQILAQPAVPTVVVGLGKPGVMLSIFGAKLGAPWTYAALERGMETYPDQPTVSDLENIYHYRAISRSTRLVGVTGFGPLEQATIAALNAAFAVRTLPARCLPLGVGNLRVFRKVLEATKLTAAVIDPEHRQAILEIATDSAPSAQGSKSADVLLRKENHWQAHDTRTEAIVSGLEAMLKVRPHGERGLHGRVVVLVGTSPSTLALGRELKRRECALIVVSHDAKAAHALAQELDARFAQFEALYSTSHDVLIVSDVEHAPGKAGGNDGVHPGYLKPGMAVVDLTGPGVEKTTLLREAETRGCAVLTPRDLWLSQVAAQARLLTGQDTAREVLAKAPWPEEE